MTRSQLRRTTIVGRPLRVSSEQVRPARLSIDASGRATWISPGASRMAGDALSIRLCYCSKLWRALSGRLAAFGAENSAA
jgi:hypothetical protein